MTVCINYVQNDVGGGGSLRNAIRDVVYGSVNLLCFFLTIFVGTDGEISIIKHKNQLSH